MDRLDVRGASLKPDDGGESALVECLGCPRRRFESIWQRQGDRYVSVAQGLTPSPYATLWAFAEALHSRNITASLPYVSDTTAISAALQSGLAQPDYAGQRPASSQTRCLIYAARIEACA